MPLRAKINGEEKTSINYSDEDWDTLKRGLKDNAINIVLPCCNQRGTLRKSSKGLKHFLHIKDQNTCDWKPESAEHLKAKVEIIKACRENGWQAIPEYAENGWRADVLATKNGKRIAFEIQWSNQTNDETILRQERYKASNVRCCWFFRTIPKQLRYYGDEYLALKEMPFFKIVRSEEATMVEFTKRTWRLEEFVNHLINGKLKFCNSYKTMQSQEVEIVIFSTVCWKCRRDQHLYTVKSDFKSRCGYSMDIIGELWSEKDIDKYPAIIKAVEEMLRIDDTKKFKIGEIKERYSKHVEDEYLSFGCYHCDAIFGDFPLANEKREARWNESNIIIKKTIAINSSRSGEHWCYSENKQFCE